MIMRNKETNRSKQKLTVLKESHVNFISKVETMTGRELW